MWLVLLKGCGRGFDFAMFCFTSSEDKLYIIDGTVAQFKVQMILKLLILCSDNTTTDPVIVLIFC